MQGRELFCLCYCGTYISLVWTHYSEMLYSTRQMCLSHRSKKAKYKTEDSKWRQIQNSGKCKRIVDSMNSCVTHTAIDLSLPRCFLSFFFNKHHSSKGKSLRGNCFVDTYQELVLGIRSHMDKSTKVPVQKCQDEWEWLSALTDWRQE